jgi:4-hydroxybenzoate polyprenyltransferase
LWSILLSSSTAAIPPATEEIAAMTALFSAGAVLLRGAGCTVNDIWDRKVDAKVERTKDRPIASGKITVPNAVAFLGAQLGLGSVVLYQLDFNTQILGLMSLPLVVAYPLMKRVTNLPQLFLGFTLNWGALMGWTAITGGVLEAPALALYGSGVCWTMVYDTIYAHQDIDDDKKIGVKSSARLFENNTKGILSTFGIGAISGLLASGYLADAHWAFYPFLLSTAGTHLFWQIYTVDLKNRKDCGDKFRSNQTYGGLVLSSILAAKVAENVL